MLVYSGKRKIYTGIDRGLFLMVTKKELQVGLWVIVGAILYGAASAIGLQLLNSTAFGYCFFCSSTIFGVLAIGVSGGWHLRYNYWKTKLHTAKISTPNKCPSPACKGDIKLTEKPLESSLGFPKSVLEMICPNCGLSLTQDAPYTSWAIKVASPEKDPEFAFLYDQESVSDSEMVEISNGHHTKKAYDKLRKMALEEVSRGQLDALKNFATQMLHPGPGVQIEIMPKRSEVADPTEKALVYISPAGLYELRTKDNSPIWVMVTKGALVITTKRFLFDGYIKDVEKRLSDIEEFKILGRDLIIRRKGKKRLEKFSGLDPELVSAILKGSGL
jgi:hypothetical protein